MAGHSSIVTGTFIKPQTPSPPVGAAAVGLIVGWTAGVGPAVGLAVGAAVGLIVGRGVGPAVGLAVRRSPPGRRAKKKM